MVPPASTLYMSVHPLAPCSVPSRLRVTRIAIALTVPLVMHGRRSPGRQRVRASRVWQNAPAVVSSTLFARKARRQALRNVRLIGSVGECEPGAASSRAEPRTAETRLA